MELGCISPFLLINDDQGAKLSVAFEKNLSILRRMSPEANQQRLAEMSDDEIVDAVSRAAAFAHRLISTKTWRGRDDGVLPNASTADDIAYEAFDDVMTKGSKWDADKDLALILSGLVRGKVKNLVNSWENSQFTDPSQIDTRESQGASHFDDLSPHVPSPSDLVCQREQDENFMLELHEALDGRPEERMIVESYIDGLTKRNEIIEHTGLSHKVFDHARKRLKRFFESDWRKNTSAHQLNVKDTLA